MYQTGAVLCVVASIQSHIVDPPAGQRAHETVEPRANCWKPVNQVIRTPITHQKISFNTLHPTRMLVPKLKTPSRLHEPYIWAV